jgi:predicted DCC family thiol-disulfide oxidoreductase YuxK
MSIAPQPPLSPSATTSLPLQVFYDGACPLCSREVKHYRNRDRNGRIEWVDIARPGFDAAQFGLDPLRVQQVMHARVPGGKVYTEVRAFVKIWEALPPGLLTTPLRWLLKAPGMIALANIFYRLFARNRYRLTGRCTPESCSVR